MKKIFLCLSLLSFISLSYAQVPSYLCQLSITSPSGSNSSCNAVFIGNGKLLTASHCFNKNENMIRDGIIVANCAGNEFTDFTSLVQTSIPANNYSEEDIALLTFSPNLNIESINPTKYPSMYFDGDHLKPNADCEILSLRGSEKDLTLHKVKIEKSMNLRFIKDYNNVPSLIALSLKSGSEIDSTQTVVEGDSGGALVCGYSKNARKELVGIIESYGRDKGTGKVLQNSFSPVFGTKAINFLNQ